VEFSTKSFLLAVLFFIIPLIVKTQDIEFIGKIHFDAFYGIKDSDYFSNGFNNRRTRIGIKSEIADSRNAIIEIDVADGVLSPTNIFMQFKLKNDANICLGHFKVPQGLNELTSSDYIAFVERATPNNLFSDSRRIGIAYEQYLDLFGFKTMIFGRKLGARDMLNRDMPIGGAFRGFASPKTGTGRLHIGTSIVYENLMDNNEVIFSDNPEARDSKGGSIKFIGTKVTDVNQTLKPGIELLYINGPFLIEGEVFSAVINRNFYDSPLFYGYYLQSRYVITGENHSYSKGSYKGLNSNRESGAWEVALRYSFADLNDAGITGGKQRNISLGINYYLTSKIRFMGNVVFTDTDILETNPVLGVIRAQYTL